MTRLWLMTVLAVPVLAADAIDVKAAFERLKSMAGDWHANSSMGAATIRVEVLAGGSALIQREKMGQMEEMVTMIHLDGDRLMLTHYCMVHNQPRMQARSYDAKNGEVRFEFVDGTNMKPTDGHMHNASFRFLSPDVVHQDWEYYEGGKRKNTESLDYRRVSNAGEALR